MQANWQPKSVNVAALARDLCLDLASFVFVDDSPVGERCRCLERRSRGGEEREREQYVGGVDPSPVSRDQLGGEGRKRCGGARLTLRPA